MIEVSVIIPVFNAELLLERCLDSIFQQASSICYEIVLVDDGSTDGSIGVAESYHDSRIKILHQGNSGPSSARNTGIRFATGNFIAFLDADDYWDPDFLLETLSFLKNSPDIVAVSVGQRHISIDNKISIVPKFLNQIKGPFKIDDFFSFWSVHHHVCTGSVLVRASIIKGINGQREDLRAGEDWEFWLLIATFGKWGMVPKLLFTSDGNKVTKNTGWIQKMRPRWENTPKVEDWEKRLITRIPENCWNGYRKARGYVAVDMILSQVLSQRFSLSREETLKYKDDFPMDNSMGKLFKICSHSGILWWIMAHLLLLREYCRELC